MAYIPMPKGRGFTPLLINDYKINVFEISFLTPEQVKLFQSDFRIVADYFVQLHNNKSYTPSTDVICHVEACLKLMSALTGDSRFETIYNEELKEEAVSMSDVLTQAIELGRKEGLKLGRQQGIEQGRKQGIEQGIEQGREQGRKQGREEEQVKAILAVADLLSPAELARRFDLPLEFVLKTLGTAAQP